MQAYERQQLDEIRRWRARRPDWGSRLLARPAGLAGQAVRKLVPVAAIRGALEGLQNLSHKLAREEALAAAAGVADISALRQQPLETCDRLALSERRRAMAVASAGGAAFGVFGGAGLVADVPTLLTWALRTIHRTGLCYGERADRDIVIGIFALASANSPQEKAEALAALTRSPDADAAARLGVTRAAERELAKDAAVLSLHMLAQRVGVNLGKRKLFGGVPLIGAAVGGVVNAWYLRDVARVAQYVFQERWLRARYPSAHF